MAELEHLDETNQEAANWIGTRQWNTTLSAQQNHKIKIFSMGDKVLWFPKDRKEHTKKFKNWWFGPFKIQYCFPNNIVLFFNIDKFEPNPILVNINKFKHY
jgi:hypothetical protein